MTNTRDWKHNGLLHIVMLILAVFAAYSKVFNAGFMSWDDAGYVLDNADIQNMDAEHISLWFKNFYIGNYHPLTMFSYAIDFMIGGKDPFMYHFTNILFHAVNAVLVYALVRRLFDVPAVALLVALLFALHPVQTESVAWVAERKNVLYGFFFLLSLLWYVGYVTSDNKWRLLGVILAGTAAMLSKAAAITLPLTLFAIDIWMQRPLHDKKLWLEKLPLLLVAVFVGIVGLKAQEQGEFLNLHPEYSWWHTILFASNAFIEYIVHLIVPYELSVLYPYPKGITAIIMIDCVLAVGVLYAAWWSYRKKLYVLCGGIVFYTVNIALVLQFVQFGEVLMADRYLYIASIGIWVPVVYYLYGWAEKAGKKTWLAAGGVVITVALLLWTFVRNDIWHSETNFWQAVVRSFPESTVAQNSMGGVYLKTGNYDLALLHIDKAIQEDESNYKAWYNKGVVHLRRNEATAAQSALDRAIQLKDYPKALFSRALLFQQTGQWQRALNDIEKVLNNNPEDAHAYFIKASCMEQLNNLDGALMNYTKAISYESNEPLFYVRRGMLYIKTIHYGAALTDLSNAIALKNNNPEAWYWRGIVKYNLGRDACGDLNEARKLGSAAAVEALMKICNTD